MIKWKWIDGEEKTHKELVVAELADDELADSILYHGADWPMNESVAKLIAAAPELLEACKKLVVFADEVLPQAGKLCFNIGNLNDGLVLARPAIEKAEKGV